MSYFTSSIGKRTIAKLFEFLKFLWNRVGFLERGWNMDFTMVVDRAY